MTDIIQKLRGLIAKATDGPWMAAASPSSIVGWPIVGQQGSSVASVTWMPKPPNVSDDDYAEFVGKCEANAKLIEAMRNHLPALLDRLEAAEGGKAMRDARPNPDWPAATAAMVALAEHGMGADIGELLTHGNPSRGIAPGAIFKMIAAIDAALVGEG